MKSLSSFLFICFLLLACTLIAQHPWPPVGEAGVDYFMNDRTVPKADGLHYRTYDNGHLYYSGMFKDGRPMAGSAFYWYDFEKDGVLVEVHHMGEDPNEIRGVKFNREGMKTAEGTYIRQQKEGTWKFWDEGGSLRCEQEFAGDLPNGTCLTYFPNGKVLKRETYTNGIKHGPWEEFYDSGRKKGQGSYKEGALHDSFELWFADGVSEIRGKFINGHKDGMWVHFNRDGSIERTTVFKSDVKVTEKMENGEDIEYFASGIPSGEFIYENGQKTGPFTEYFDVGEWVRTPVEQEGPGQGLTFRESLEGRKKKREGEYLDGQLNGEIRHYNEDGRLMRIETWDEGTLVETVER